MIHVRENLAYLAYQDPRIVTQNDPEHQDVRRDTGQ